MVEVVGDPRGHDVLADLQPVDPDVVETFMRAARNFAGVIAESLAQVDDVTLPQLRVLVLASRRQALSNTQVADALRVHLSNATRICDRLVSSGLLDRRESKADRRRVELTLTDQGAQLVAVVMAHRRAALVRILQHVPPETAAMLAVSLDVFSDVAEVVRETEPSPF